MAELSDPALPERVMRRAQWRIIPIIFAAYLIAIIDRNNISFAAATMNRDLGFTATIYGFAGGVFFVSYALLEVPSNIAMMRFGPRLWMARIMISWGLLSAAHMFVSTPTQFYVLRFLLGAAEAGFIPAVMYYVSLWFPVQWRGRAVSRFYVAQPFAAIVLGILSAPILSLDGAQGLHGWQWLFLLEALPAVILGIIFLLFLPDSPAKVGWLSPAERDWLTSTLAAEAAANSAPRHSSVLAALADRRIFLFGLAWFSVVGMLSAYTLSLPQILAEKTGFDTAGVGQLVTLGGIIGVVALLALGWQSDRKQERWWHIMVPWLLVAGGLAALALAPSPAVAIAGFLLIALAYQPSQPIFHATLQQSLHQSHRAVGIAAVNTFGQIGAFLSTSSMGVARDATGNHDVALAVIAGFVVIGIIATNGLRRQAKSE